jgi:hypothetical protein
MIARAKGFVARLSTDVDSARRRGIGGVPVGRIPSLYILDATKSPLSGDRRAGLTGF